MSIFIATPVEAEIPVEDQVDIDSAHASELEKSSRCEDLGLVGGWTQGEVEKD